MGEYDNKTTSTNSITLPLDIFLQMNRLALGAQAIINLINSHKYITTDDVLVLLGESPLLEADGYARKPDVD